MPFFPSIEKAIVDIRQGKIVVVVDDEARENEGDMVMAAAKITPQKIAFMLHHGSGVITVPLTDEIAERLMLSPMVFPNTERQRTNFTVSVDYKHGTSTGISASDRAKTIKALADLQSPADFLRPGHVFPLRARDGGIFARAGHTEAAVDLVSLAGFAPVGVLCEVVKKDGEMARLPFLKNFSKKNNLTLITIKDLIAYRTTHEQLVKKITEVSLPTFYGDFKLYVYKTLIDNKEYLALVKGQITGHQPCLVRIHSECFTGDVFRSERCDCGLQLEKSLQIIAQQKRGVLLYMRQEGRGVGFVNKMKAYKLQQKGYDTVDANKKLGFEADLRSYALSAKILKDLGIKKIFLLTNNPAKILDMKRYGIEVTKRIPLEIKPTKANKYYLETKKRRLGHWLRHV